MYGTPAGGISKSPFPAFSGIQLKLYCDSLTVSHFQLACFVCTQIDSNMSLCSPEKPEPTEAKLSQPVQLWLLCQTQLHLLSCGTVTHAPLGLLLLAKALVLNFPLSVRVSMSTEQMLHWASGCVCQAHNLGKQIDQVLHRVGP